MRLLDLESSPDGWVNDDRGKVSIWIGYRDISLEDIFKNVQSGDGSLIESTEKELHDLCKKAFDDLFAGTERYVVRVPPERGHERFFEKDVYRVYARCRVRWCKDQETVDRWAQMSDSFHATASAGGYTGDANGT